MSDHSELALLREWKTRATAALWEPYILRPTLPMLGKAGLAEVPAAAGIYLFRTDEGDPIYLGRSDNLSRRLGTYFRSPKSGGARFSYLAVPDFAYADVEIAHIYALEPPNNSLFAGTPWTFHDAMRQSIRAAWGLS